MDLEPCEIDLGLDGAGFVRLMFPDPVKGMALTPAMARDLAHNLWELARAAERPRDFGPVDPCDQDPIDRLHGDG